MQEHKQWFYYAESDLIVAKAGLQSEDVRIGPILYLAQQCAEKALKSYLVFKRKPIRKTHDLVELVNMCGDIDIEFQVLKPEAEELTPYVTQARYPDNRFLMPSVSEAEWAIKQAEKF